MSSADGLPPLCREVEDMRGPTPTSNWVVPGRLIAGAYPGSKDPDLHNGIIRTLIEAGDALDWSDIFSV